MAKLDDAKRQKLAEEHGEIVVITHKRAGDAAFKGPSRPLWEQFQSRVLNDKTKASSTSWLVRSCLIFPDAAEFETYLDRYPMLAEKAGAQLVELAGGGEEDVTVKKYESAASKT